MNRFFKGRLGLYERLDEGPRAGWWRASRWRLWTADPAADQTSEQTFVTLYRFKTFLAIFEATGLTIMLTPVAWRSPAVATVIVAALLVIVTFAIAIAVVGFLALLCDFLVRICGGSLLKDRTQSVLKYLALSQAAMLIGIYQGLYLVEGDLRRLGFLLTGAGGLAALVTFLLALPLLQPSREKSRGNSFPVLVWGAVFALGAATGVAIRTSEVLEHYFRLDLVLFIVLSPLCALVTAIHLRRRFRSLLPPRPAPALRRAIAFCVLTAFLPLGGLAIPLWILIRRRLLIALASPSLAPMAELRGGEQHVGHWRCLSERRVDRESRHYFFSHAIAHFAVTGKRQKIYELFEETTFLQDQMSHFGGFSGSSQDLETYVIPSAIEALDWRRFIHFTMLALHLRGAAEDLLDLIEPLSQGGLVSIALDAVKRIAGPLERCGAKAMIASKLAPDSEIYQQHLQSLSHDLASMPPLPTDPALVGPMTEKQYWMTVVVAQTFGLAAEQPLRRFLKDRPAWWHDVVLIMMAERHADKNGLLDASLWAALRNLQDPALLKEFLPEQLLACDDPQDPETFLACLDGLSEDPELSWLCRFTLLDLIARTSLERATSLWQCWKSERPVRWTLQVVEQATPFLSRLEGPQVQDLAQSAGDPEVKAGLLLSRASAAASAQEIEEIERVIENVPAGAQRIHWQLRFLGLRTRHLSRSAIRSEITRLAHSLNELKYGVENPDLRSYFELVAAYQPDRLKRELTAAFWSANATSESLVEIIDTTKSVALLTHLLEKLDRYILPFRPGEAQGFEVWWSLLRKIVPRLCVLTRSIFYLTQTIELNPDQADELRTATVKALVDAGAPDLVKAVCSTFSSRRQSYLTKLKLVAATDPHALTTASLFEAFADSEMVRDEIAGLCVLAEMGNAPPLLLPTRLGRINSRQERFLALLRRVDLELARPDQRDRHHERLDSLVQAAGLVTSDTHLSGLAPEVTAIVAVRSERQAITETREALERLLLLSSVPWPVRREICETLLSRLLPLLAARAEHGRWEESEFLRMVMGPLDWIEHGSNEEIEERGILPVLFAVMDRMPFRAWKRFVKGLPSEGVFPVLYVADDSDLGGVLDRLVEEDRFYPLIVETVLYLFSYRLPDFVPDVLRDLSAGPFRDTVAARLLRHGWLPAELAPEVLPLIESPAVRLSTEITLALGSAAGSEDEATWLRRLVSILDHQLVDPTDPRNEPWIRKLWTIEPERSRPILARGVLSALAQAGRWHGVSALCLWLHAHLAPDAGRDPVELLALCAEAEQAVQRAVTLPSIPISTNA